MNQILMRKLSIKDVRKKSFKFGAKMVIIGPSYVVCLPCHSGGGCFGSSRTRPNNGSVYRLPYFITGRHITQRRKAVRYKVRPLPYHRFR